MGYRDQDITMGSNKKTKGTRYSVNHITIPQLLLACKHYSEMRGAGFTLNLAIRNLELFSDTKAQQVTRGMAAPLSAEKEKRWSKAAIKEKKANPNKKFGEY